MVSATIAYVEIRASLTKAHRAGRLTRAGFNEARGQFMNDWNDMTLVSLQPDVLGLAADLADRHALRALDAIHLASFQQVLERTDDDVEFSTFDERLAKAAKKLR